MNIDLDRITHPLRLAKGSHQPGSGKGCAMNVVSYVNGDTRITDYPDCSARPLASLVQICNDRLADVDGYLSPENSIIALDLGWRTIGTATSSDKVHALWIAEVLTNPEWGVIRFAKGEGVQAIRAIADLHRKSVTGQIPFAWNRSAAWSAAWSAARSAAESAAWSAAWSAAESAAWSAARSAARSAAWYAAESAAESASWSAAESAAESAAWSAAWSDAESDAWSDAWSAAYIEFTGHAIDCWRDLMELDQADDISADEINSALARIRG